MWVPPSCVDCAAWPRADCGGKTALEDESNSQLKQPAHPLQPVQEIFSVVDSGSKMSFDYFSYIIVAAMIAAVVSELFRTSAMLNAIWSCPTVPTSAHLHVIARSRVN